MPSQPCAHATCALSCLPVFVRPLQEFLYAASRGDNNRLRAFLEQGFDVNTADYGEVDLG